MPNPRQELVTIVHPRLEHPARVPASAVRIHRESGWVPQDEYQRARRAPKPAKKEDEEK